MLDPPEGWKKKEDTHCKTCSYPGLDGHMLHGLKFVVTWPLHPYMVPQIVAMNMEADDCMP